MAGVPAAGFLRLNTRYSNLAFLSPTLRYNANTAFQDLDPAAVHQSAQDREPAQTSPARVETSADGALARGVQSDDASGHPPVWPFDQLPV